MPRFAVIILFLCFAWASAQESVPLTTQTAGMTADWPEWRWTILAGDDALKSGLPAMAEALYRKVLSQDIPAETRRAVDLKLASSLIAQRRFDEAGLLLQQLPKPGSPAVELRRAIVALNQSDIEKADDAMELVDAKRLSRGDRPWSFLVRGLIARAKGRGERATGYIEEAMESSVSPIQRAQFDALLLTGRIGDSPPDDDLLDLLSRKMQDNKGTRPGFTYAREYAVVLDQMGQKAAAIDVLQEQLRLITADEPDERLQTLLLIGLIAGPETRRGQLALEDILKDASNPSLPRIALYLLAEVRREPAQAEAFRNFLKSLLDDPKNPIRDEILILRARLRLDEGEREGAAADAERILAEFPASAYSNDARWILARLAWEAARYRAAADYLQRIRDSMPQGDARTQLSQLIGDCYFQNADYATAAAVYNGALQDAKTAALRETLAYQGIISEIRAGNLTEAARLIDAHTALPEADTQRLWRAEWNLVEALRRSGKSAEAFARLSLKLRDKPLSSIQPELRLRLMWLWAFVFYEAGQYGQVPDIASEALQLIDSSDADELPDAEKRLLGSSLMLLEARAELRSGNPERSLALFKQLRSDYPGTDAAISSFLIEARYLAAEYRLVDAQSRLRELADHYPDSPLAPAALLEAATLAEKQGQDRNYKEATEILKALLDRYPGHPLVFHATLQIGNLARKQNNFGGAQILYEKMLRDYAGRDDEFPLYLPELYRADSLLAQSSGDPLRLDAAVEGLDRVLDNNSTPVDARIEAGYKQALIYIRQGNSLRARETLWLMVTRILKDPAVAAQMGTRGRYWMARSLVELGSLLEAAGSKREASEVYQLIPRYGLPGESLIKGRVETNVN